MTEERNSRQSDSYSDSLVTRLYRDAADDRSPEYLDRAILKEAEKAARPRYRRFISWTRPMAWAATIMLSVALVLEVTKAPTPDGAMYDDNASKLEAQGHDAERSADTPAAALEESVSPAVPLGRTSNAATNALPQTATMKSPAKQTVPEAKPEMRQRGDIRLNQVAEQELAAPAATGGEFEHKDAASLLRTEETVRVQDGGNETPDLTSSSADAVSAERPAPSSAALRILAPTCDESVTASPETWLDCIVELEEAGLADEARLQRDRLDETFPDFDLR